MIPLENITVGELLLRSSRKYASRPAVWYKGNYISYGDFNELIIRYAGALYSMGVKKGMFIGLWAEPEPDAVAVYYSIQLIGAVAVLINTSLVDEEAERLLEFNDVSFLLTGKSYKTGENVVKGRITAVRKAGVKQIFTIGSCTLDEIPSLTETADRVSDTEMEAAVQMEHRVNPEDTAVILFTSGSAGISKGVMSSHYSRVNGGIQQAGDLLCSEEDRFCITMPLYHCFCISVNLMAALSVGACICIPEDRHIRSIIDTIEQCRCTVMSSVPTMFHAMISGNKTSGRDLSSLRIGFIGGSNYPPKQFIEIEQAMGPQFTLMSSLGQTECTAGLTTCFQDDSIEVRATTVGHFMSHVEGRIADINTGKTLPDGQAGEICVRGYLNMQGYYKLPELTAKTIDAEGWVHTNDVGRLDAKGNITLLGRIKEIIIRGGENISPLEVEHVLNNMEGIRSSKVVGVPDDHYGEEICACIIKDPNMDVSEEEVRRVLSLHLADYKIPKYICYFDSFPTTSTGKIRHMQVKEMAMNKLGLEM